MFSLTYGELGSRCVDNVMPALVGFWAFSMAGRYTDSHPYCKRWKVKDQVSADKRRLPLSDAVGGEGRRFHTGKTPIKAMERS